MMGLRTNHQGTLPTKTNPMLGKSLEWRLEVLEELVLMLEFPWRAQISWETCKPRAGGCGWKTLGLAA
jgi:hypothetical protein